MPCFRPLQAFRCADGGIVFVDNLRRNDVIRTEWIPCGRCIGCLNDRSVDWSVRGMHEASMHVFNSAPTLTYSDEFVPYRGMIQYTDVQKAIKRLRFATKLPISYMVGCEYGSENWRPHYHMALFGFRPPDMKFWRTSDSGARLFRSEWFEKRVWPYGHVEIGEVTPETVGYIAKYCQKRVYGDAAKLHYMRVDPKTGEVYHLPPEQMHVSKRPAIGRTFIEKFASDVFVHDHVVLNGHERQPPRYYDKQLKRVDPDLYEEMRWKREQDARKRADDNTPERLAVREQVALAEAKFFKRTM